MLTTEALEAIGGMIDSKLEAFGAAQTAAGQLGVESMLDRLAKKDKVVLEPGIALARVCMGVAAEHARVSSRAQYLEQNFGKEFASYAIGSDTISGGGAAVRPEFANDFIEPLRAAAVVRQLKPIQLQTTSGTLTIPKMVTGSTGSWIGENQKASISTPTYGNVIALSKKLSVLVPVGKDFLRRAVAGSDQMVRDDMIAGAAESEDDAFINGLGTQYTPKGLITAAGETFTMTGSVTLATVMNDLWEPIRRMKDNKVPFRRPGYLIPPCVEKFLMLITTTNGGQFPFRDEMTQKGTINGYPYRVTPQITDNGSVTTVVFADFGHVVVVDELAIRVEESSEAAYVDAAGATTSAFQNDQILVRLLTETDIVLRHSKAVCTITGVTWGVA